MAQVKSLGMISGRREPSPRTFEWTRWLNGLLVPRRLVYEGSGVAMENLRMLCYDSALLEVDALALCYCFMPSL